MSLTTRASRAVVLIGHGGVPADFPREKVRRLMALEAARQSTGEPPGSEEQSLDHELRTFPRTPENDPYRVGLIRLQVELAAALFPQPVYLAFNEFCAPSVQDAVAHAIADGCRDVLLITSMMTPGGSHSEVEIPQIIAALTPLYPEVTLRYAWPIGLEKLAGFMAGLVREFRNDPTGSEDAVDAFGEIADVTTH